MERPHSKARLECELRTFRGLSDLMEKYNKLTFILAFYVNRQKERA